MTCYCCADDRVGSSSDKVPNWEEIVRYNPLHVSHMVKGEGQDAMVKLIEESYAPSKGIDLLENNRSKRVSLSLHGVSRLQVSNVLARNCCITGVQTPPTVSVMVKCVERGKAVSLPCARYGRQTVRHAVGAAALRMC